MGTTVCGVAGRYQCKHYHSLQQDGTVTLPLLQHRKIVQDKKKKRRFKVIYTFFFFFFFSSVLALSRLSWTPISHLQFYPTIKVIKAGFPAPSMGLPSLVLTYIIMLRLPSFTISLFSLHSILPSFSPPFFLVLLVQNGLHILQRRSFKTQWPPLGKIHSL